MRACGVEHVRVIDPYDVKGSIDVVVEAMTFPGPSVVISRRQCSLQWLRESKVKVEPYGVDPEMCKGCKLCVNEFRCPAIVFKREENVAAIDEALCIGCGVCAKICPHEAIRKGV